MNSETDTVNGYDKKIYIFHNLPFNFLPFAGAFNPSLEDPLPGQMKKQLVLKIISGQQLPKPKDSMLGDRGEVRHKCIIVTFRRSWNLTSEQAIP